MRPWLHHRTRSKAAEVMERASHGPVLLLYLLLVEYVRGRPSKVTSTDAGVIFFSALRSWFTWAGEWRWALQAT